MLRHCVTTQYVTESAYAHPAPTAPFLSFRACHESCLKPGFPPVATGRTPPDGRRLDAALRVPVSRGFRTSTHDIPFTPSSAKTSFCTAYRSSEEYTPSFSGCLRYGLSRFLRIAIAAGIAPVLRFLPQVSSFLPAHKCRQLLQVGFTPSGRSTIR